MFCKMPFTHSFVDGQIIKPCCLFEGDSTLKDVRKQFLNKIKPDGCRQCYEKEDLGEISSRQWYNHRFSDIEFEADVDYHKPKTFDLRIDNVCNLKCVMCGPDQSTKWKEDAEIYNEFVDWHPWERKIPLPDLSEALEISILGGEPFYMKSAYDLLLEQSKNTRIILNTNACIDESNKLLSILGKFSEVEIVISIDGYKNVNEYIRYPSKWNEFESGINLIFSLDNFVEYKPFNTTVSCLNLPDLNNIIDFTKQFTNSKHYLHFLTYPDFLDINALHPKVINYCLDMIEDDFVVGHIKQDYKFDKQKNNKMRLYLEKLDDKRKTNSKVNIPWCWYES